MQAILNMAKRSMAVSKVMSPGASAIQNIALMAALSHDGLTSDTYQKPDIPNWVTFQDSALLSGPQKINKKLNILDNDIYASRAEKNEKSGRQYKTSERSNFIEKLV